MLIKRNVRNVIENSSALSDMAFLLIIYFIVIAGFSGGRFLLMELPQKGNEIIVPRDEIIRFSIDKTGALLFLEQRLGPGEASNIIRKAVLEKPNIAVILGIDENAPWQSVVSFVDLARNNHVDSFSFSLLSGTEEP